MAIFSLMSSASRLSLMMEDSSTPIIVPQDSGGCGGKAPVWLVERPFGIHVQYPSVIPTHSRLYTRTCPTSDIVSLFTVVNMCIILKQSVYEISAAVIRFSMVHVDYSCQHANHTKNA